MFNQVQYDEATKQRMSTYESLMDGLSRFEVQLYAKSHDVPFKWGVTPKPSIIMMMKDQGVPVPTREDIAKLIQLHRAETRTSAYDKSVEVEQKPISVQNEEVGEDAPDYENMKRPELVKLAHNAGLKSPMKYKNEELIKVLMYGENSLGNDE